MEVTLVDRGAVAGQNTSLAASLFTQARSKAHHIPLVKETYHAIAELETLLKEKLGVQKIGTVHIASSVSSTESQNELVTIANAHHLAVEDAPDSSIEEWFPWLDRTKIQKALFFPEDIYVDSTVLTRAYVDGAKANGARVLLNTNVEKIVIRNNQVSAIEIESGTLECDVVVDAAGCWSNLISAPVGFQLPMAPVRSIYWITEQNSDLFPPHQPVCILPDAKAYTRPENGALLFGIRDSNCLSVKPQLLPDSIHDIKLINDTEQYEILEHDGKPLERLFPELYSVGIKHVVSGLSSYTVDGEFVIGESSFVKGLFAATGCSGAGVATSGGIGRLISELVSNQLPFTDISRFKPDRCSEDVLTISFVRKCALMRSGKRDG